MAQQATLEAAHVAPIPARARPGPCAAKAAIPAVIYGHNRAAEPLTVDSAGAPQAALRHQRREHHPRRRRSTVEAPVKALIREIQRNPLRSTDILHLDLYEVRADEKITVEVPIHLVGTADGVRNFGGVWTR